MNETTALVNEFLKKASGSDALKTKNKKDLDFKLRYSVKDVTLENDSRIKKEEHERKVLFEKAVSVDYCDDYLFIEIL